MPARAMPQPGSANEAIAAANALFYEAFTALSLEQMDAIWAQEEWIECVHPGWHVLVGWEAVRESWAHIFAGTARVQIELSGVSVHAEGDVGWVVCTERVTSTFSEGFDQVLVQTTNVFVRRGERWLMVAHHASPLPAAPLPAVQ